jgi:subtilase family serine protease
MAPQADHLTLYFGSDLADANIAAIFSSWEADPNAPLQANASFGECEPNPVGAALDNPLLSPLAGTSLPVGTGLVNDLQPIADPILLKATLQGKTLFAATGDTGSSCPAIALPVVGAGNGLVNQVVPFLNYPASSPYVTAVGGTVLYTNGSGTSASRAQESAWTFGGGGASLFAPAPAYQHGVPELDRDCLLSASGAPAPAGVLCRGVPDVAALSGDALGNGYPTISGGQPSVGAGTSLSSPLWMGMWARVQGTAGGGGYGFANELLYRAGKNPATAARDFTDITTGLLGIPTLGNGLYTTGPGWDYVTGWGVPNLANLIADAPTLG